MAQSWDALRADARRLETEIDSKLVDYSKLAASLQSSSNLSRPSFDSIRQTTEAVSLTPSRAATRFRRGDEAVQRRNAAGRDAAAAEALTAEMDALLTKLTSVIDAMSAHKSSPGKPINAAADHTLRRHSEILNDYWHDFRKTRASIASLRDHAELMAGAERTCVAAATTTAPDASGIDSLYKEKASISNASAGADTAIATGLSLKEDLDRQRAMFASMVERVETMSDGLPTVHRLIGQIRWKKKRDVLILGAVVSVLMFIYFSWKVLG